MTDVFISYARANAKTARALADKLERNGYSVWWDEQIAAGQSFEVELERKLADARAVLVLWSQESVESPWVREEASYARELDKLIPVTTVPADKVPLGFRTLQSINLEPNPAEVPQPAEEAIVRAIEAIIERDQGKAKPTRSKTEFDAS